MSRIGIAILFSSLASIVSGAVHTVTIDVDAEVGTVGPYLVGGNIVYSKDEGPDWESKNKVDVLKRAGLSNLRYPGGHVVSFWDWEFPYHNAYQNFWDPAYTNTLTETKKAELKAENGDRLSLDDYLDICAESGAIPLIGINMFQGYRFDRDADSVAKAVRLVNYVKSKIPGPKYYYLDNEAGHQPEKNNHVPIDDYLLLVPDYSTAIKAADPEGLIAVNIMSWNRVQEIVRDYGDHVDLYDQHWYYNNISWGQFWPDEWRADVNMGDYTRRLNQFNGWVETYDKPHLKIGFLEWNLGPARGEDGSTPGNVFHQGLVQADMLMHMIRYDVHMASIWPLTWDDNYRNLIDGPDHVVSPTIYIHRALSKAAGGTMLELSGPDTSGLLRMLAVKSADEAFVDLFLLNKSTNSMDVEIDLPIPIVETLVMTYTQGATSNSVNVSEERVEGEPALMQFTLADTSFTHVRYRISGGVTGYELFADDFETSSDLGDVASAPYLVGAWHHQSGLEWMIDSSANDTSVDIGEFNGIAGNELRIGWGYDEVVTLLSTPAPIHTDQTYTFRGRWEIGNVFDVPRGFIAGIAEFSAEDGSLVQRLTSDTQVFGNSNAPVIGEKGIFEVSLGPIDLAAAGLLPGNRIGVFLHHDDGGDLYDDAHPLKNDVYYIDNVTLEVSGTVTMLDQWMVSNKVADALADPDDDSVDNRSEYYFGGDPTVNDALDILPSYEIDGGWLEYVYRRRSDYQMRGLSYTVEATTNLGSGSWSTSSVVDAGHGSVNSEMESVTNRVTTEMLTEQYIRLRVE